VQLPVDHDDGAAQAAHDRLEEMIDVVQRLAAIAQLPVDRLDLLVGRLQLLVRRFDDRSTALTHEVAVLRELIAAGRVLEPIESRHSIET
jgi:hypothetical protein